MQVKEKVYFLGDVHYQIGLDNVHRMTQNNDSTFVAVEHWTSPNTFSLDVKIVGYSTFDIWEFTLEDDAIRVTEVSVTGEYTYNGEAK